MYVCAYCKEVFSQPKIYLGKPIHVCNPWYYDEAVCVEKHDCKDYVEEIFDELGNLVSRCFVCNAAAQHSLAPDAVPTGDTAQ